MSAAAVDTPEHDTNGEAPARPRYGLGALAFMLACGMLIGFGVGLLIMRPTTPDDHSVEAGFARDMSLHHGQAVEMGMIAYERAELPEVRLIGMDIALTQQAQFGSMQQWLRDWGLLPTGPEPPMAWMPDGEAALQDGLMPGMATPEQMEELRTASGLEVDRMFLQLMIDHHLGGIHMVDGVLAVTSDAQVRFLAESMKDGQQRELSDLRGLQTLVEQAG